MAHYIKVRELGRKSWSFLARGGTTRLRMHAARFDTREKAQQIIDDNAGDNPDWEWKVVEA